MWWFFCFAGYCYYCYSLKCSGSVPRWSEDPSPGPGPFLSWSWSRSLSVVVLVLCEERGVPSGPGRAPVPGPAARGVVPARFGPARSAGGGVCTRAVLFGFTWARTRVAFSVCSARTSGNGPSRNYLSQPSTARPCSLRRALIG